MLHLFFHKGHSHARKIRAERLKTFEQCAVERAKETGNALHVENVNHLVDRPVWQARPKGLVCQLSERRFISGRLDHAIELALLTSFGGSLQFVGSRLQLPGEKHSLLNFGLFRGICG